AITSFGSIIEGGLKKISDNIPALIDTIKSRVNDITGIFRNVGSDVKANNYKNVGETIGSGIASGLNAAVSDISIGTESISKWFSRIDWGKLGIEIGKQSVGFIA